PQVRLIERAAHAELARRLAARAVIAAIVGVVAVDHHGLPVGGNPREVCVQLVLAVVTAVRRIGAVLWPVELVRPDDLVPQTELLGDLNGEPPMSFGIAGAVGGYRERAATEDVGGDTREVRAVDAAAGRHHDRSATPEPAAQRGLRSH